MEKALIIRLIVFVAAWLNGFLAEKGLQPLPLVGEEEAAMFLAFLISVWALYQERKKAKEKLDKLPK